MSFWVALASSAFCGWVACWLAVRLARRKEGYAKSLDCISPVESPIDVSSGWPLAAGLGTGFVLGPLLMGVSAVPEQKWWLGVYLVVAVGVVVSSGSHWVVLRWRDVLGARHWDGVVPAILVAVAFGCAVAITQIERAVSPGHLLLAGLLVAALVWMLAVDGKAKPVSLPLLGSAFLYGMAQVIASPDEAPIAASVVAGAIVATVLPQSNALVRPIPFWGQSVVVLFIASDAVFQGAWIAFALAAVTAVGLSLLMWSLGLMRGTLQLPTWSFWGSAGLVLCVAAVVAAIHGANGSMAIGVGLSVLAAAALLGVTAIRDVLAEPSLAAALAPGRAVSTQPWSRKQLAREITNASSCQRLWHLVLRSHAFAGLVSVKWQLPGSCFETASQERDPEKQWMISIPLAPSAWIEAEWDPSSQCSLNEATSYLTSIAERASALTLEHIETLFGDSVDSDSAV